MATSKKSSKKSAAKKTKDQKMQDILADIMNSGAKIVDVAPNGGGTVDLTGKNLKVVDSAVAVDESAQQPAQPEQPAAKAEPKYPLKSGFKVTAIVNGKPEFVAYADTEEKVQSEIERNLEWRERCGSNVTAYEVVPVMIHQISYF